jgi:hypothetical protein
MKTGFRDELRECLARGGEKAEPPKTENIVDH